MDRLRSGQVQRDHATGDVDDRVDRAHVVELHRLAIGTVHARLGVGEPREDPRRPLADARLERAALQNIEDVAQRPMMDVSRAIDLDIDLGRPK